MYLAVKAVLRKMKEQNQHSIDRSRPKLMEALHGVYYSNKFYYSSLLQLACHRYLKKSVSSSASSGHLFIECGVDFQKWSRF
jgi:hypothetical protein